MRRIKSNITLIILTAFLFCCADPDHQESSSQSEKSEKKDRMKSVMINKTQCELHGEFKDLSLEEIIGVWKDTIIWKMQPNDSCYYGVDELDVNYQLEIKPTKTFKFSTTFSKPSYDRVEMGEYFLYYDSVRTTLTLANNPKGEFVFQHGDTMKQSIIYDLRWVDANTIILDGKIKKGKHILREAIELKKTTR